MDKGIVCPKCGTIMILIDTTSGTWSYICMKCNHVQSV